MMHNWMEKLSQGVKPSRLFMEEINRCGECDSSHLVDLLLHEVLPEKIATDIDLQDIFYPIWNWEKPGKERKNGISTEEMDEWILNILKQWRVLK